MNLKTVIALSTILLIIPAFWPDGVTQAATITVEMGGDATCTKSGTGNWVDIGGPCPTTNPKVIIAPKSTTGSPPANLARVEVLGTDTSTDVLRLTNAKITANQALNNFHITFRRDDPRLPDTAITSVYYKVWLNGTIPAGNSLTASATVEHPVGSTPVLVGTKTVTGAFNTSANAVQWTQALNNTRILKVDLVITLAQGKTLDLGNWVRLADQPSGDEDSNTGGNWFAATTEKFSVKSAYLTEDGLVKKEAQVHLFMDSNWDHLSQDLAQAHGEYLASLASLLDIAPTNYPSFSSLAQHQYAELSRRGQVDPEEMLQLLAHSTLTPMSVANVSQPREN